MISKTDRWYIRDVSVETQINLNTIASNSNINVAEVIKQLSDMVVRYAHQNGISYAQALAKIHEKIEDN